MGFLDNLKNGKKEKKSSRFPTQTGLCIRVIAAVYLLYLSYDLYKTREASTIPYGALIAILALFVICSIYFIANSIYLYVKGMYVGGKADVEEAEEDHTS